jgi:hypothetical protein
VRQRHDEPLAVLVEHRESDLVLVKATVHGVAREVREGVVHPSHVPLEGEPEATVTHRRRDAGPGRGLLGDRHASRRFRLHRLVELLQELDGFEILAAALPVAQPLSGLPAVVQIQHRRDGIDPQAVHVELVEPVHRVGDEEVPHLRPAVVEDQRAPIGMFAESRVLVLVERGAVEATQREVVFWKVRRNPVENDADPAPMQGVYEKTEIVRRPVSRRRGVVAADLIAPRAVKRVLHDRHELHVREPELAHVIGELRRDLTV